MLTNKNVVGDVTTSVAMVNVWNKFVGILKMFIKINDVKKPWGPLNNPTIFYVVYFGKYFQYSHKFILNIRSIFFLEKHQL